MVKPWRITPEGPMPLIVPPNALDAMRARWPNMWIEASPLIPTNTGKPITMAEWKRLALPPE